MMRKQQTLVAGIVLAAFLCAAYVMGQGTETMRFDPARLESDYGLKIETKEKVLAIKVGDTLNAVVTDPGKVAAAGLSGTQKGNKLKLTWEGKTTWGVGPRDNKMKALAGRMIVMVPTYD